MRAGSVRHRHVMPRQPKRFNCVVKRSAYHVSAICCNLAENLLGSQPPRAQKRGALGSAHAPPKGDSPAEPLPSCCHRHTRWRNNYTVKAGYHVTTWHLL